MCRLEPIIGQMLPIMKEHRRPIERAFNHHHVRLECRPQFQGWLEVTVPHRLEGRIELIGGTVDDLPEQFFFTGNVRVQAATLHAKRFGEVTHRGGVIPQFGKEFPGGEVNLFFSGQAIVHRCIVPILKHLSCVEIRQ